MVPLILAPLLGGQEDSRADFSPVVALLHRAIEQHAFPGCAIVAGTHEGPLLKKAFGAFDYEGGPSARTNSIYDLASLTKVVGTTSVVLALVRDGHLSLLDPVVRHVPEFTGGGRDKVTVEHLLTHTSGLPAWRPLYREAEGYEAVLAAVLATDLECPPGTRRIYSDLGFILLGEVASRAGGRPLAELEKKLVFEPLGLSDTTRRPWEKEGARVVPTERRPPVSKREPSLASGAEPPPVRGVPHDENAAAADGLTGHAGLFSTAEDLAVFARELLRGHRGESRLFPRKLIVEFTSRRDIVQGSSRALGWDTPSKGSSAGTLLGPEAFGHTGFTGTSLWVDPEKDLFILLLTNRVYPTRSNLKILEIRKRLADTVVRCLEEKVRSF